MKFKTYLNEGRSKSIDFDDAVELVVKNAKRNFKSIYMTGKTLPIYRGAQQSMNTGYVNTNKGIPRTSAYQSNYMTLLMDNLPSWSKYPKRSRGLVCTTDTKYSGDYGSLYHVIPYDNTLVGVAPSYDIFWSFPKLLGSDGYARQFNDYLDNMFDKHQLINNDKDWKIFRKSLIKLSGLIKREYDKYKIFKEDKLIMDTLNKELSPTKNGFKLGVKNLKPEREVWIQGESILVSGDFMDDFIEEVMDEI